jgi:hypothetical protein
VATAPGGQPCHKGLSLTFGDDCSQDPSAVGSTRTKTWSTVSGTASLPFKSTSRGCWQMAAARRSTSGECRVALNRSTWHPI